MIYYNDELLDLRKPTTEVEKEVASQLSEVEKTFFGPNSKGIARLLWENGKRKKNSSGFYEIPKLYALELVSGDMMYRYSPTKATFDANKNPKYAVHHEYVRDSMTFQKKDLELIWFIKYQSAAYKAGILVFEDKAQEAKKEVSKMAEDTELRFYLMSKQSPLANDEKGLRSIAEAFGIADVRTLSMEELKLAIYDVVQDGEKKGDRICNHANFIEFTNVEGKHKIASKAREAVRTGDLVFDKDKFAWAFKGSDDVFIRIKGNEVLSKEVVLIDTIINSPRHASILRRYYGEDSELTAEEVRSMKRPDLNSTAKLHEVEVSSTDKNEVIAEKIIKHLGLS